MSTKKDDNTCIQLPKKLKDELASMGAKNDTYADIIKDLMKFEKPEDNAAGTEDTVEGENDE